MKTDVWLSILLAGIISSVFISLVCQSPTESFEEKSTKGFLSKYFSPHLLFYGISIWLLQRKYTKDLSGMVPGWRIGSWYIPRLRLYLQRIYHEPIIKSSKFYVILAPYSSSLQHVYTFKCFHQDQQTF